MRAVTDAQVRKLMEEMSKHGRIGDAAMKAGHGSRDRAQDTSRPASCRRSWSQPRDWRTRPDPFEEHWPEIEAAPARDARARGEDAVRVAAGDSTPAATTTASCARCSGA